MNIEILFEDEDVLVINKPVGVMAHPDGHREGETVSEWFLNRQPEVAGVGEPQRTPHGVELERSGIVHRLDTDTSGVMILAKHQTSFEHLKAQFHDRLVKKEYRAFVYGAMRERWGTISRSIGRSAKDFRLRSAEAGSKGLRREAVTDWECITAGRYHEEHFSYLKLIPKTGRTHQLRVHLKAISRPIVGDILYAPGEVATSSNLELNRMALHAHKLHLILPSGAEELFIAPVPFELEQAAERIANE